MAERLPVAIEITYDDNGAVREVRHLKDGISSVDDAAGKASTGGLGQLKGALAGLGLAALAKEAISFGADIAVMAAKGGMAALQMSDQFELLRIRLESLRGSSEQAGKDFEFIRGEALALPASIKDVTDQFVSLVAFGLEPTDGTMRNLMDAGFALTGSMEGVEGVTRAVGQAFAKGKLQGEEALQMLERGVPVWDMLGDILGKTSGEVQKLSEQGLLGREAIEALIASMGAEYAGAAEAQMETLSGKMSNLRDSIDQAAAAIGMEGQPGAKRALDELIGIISDAVQRGDVERLGDMLGGVTDAVADLAMFARTAGPAISEMFRVIGADLEKPLGFLNLISGGGLGAGRAWWQDATAAMRAASEAQEETMLRVEMMGKSAEERQELFLKHYYPEAWALQEKIRKEIEAQEKAERARVALIEAQNAKLDEQAAKEQAKERAKLDLNLEETEQLATQLAFQVGIQKAIDLMNEDLGGAGGTLDIMTMIGDVLGDIDIEAALTPPEDMSAEWRRYVDDMGAYLSDTLAQSLVEGLFTGFEGFDIGSFASDLSGMLQGVVGAGLQEVFSGQSTFGELLGGLQTAAGNQPLLFGLGGLATMYGGYQQGGWGGAVQGAAGGWSAGSALTQLLGLGGQIIPGLGAVGGLLAGLFGGEEDPRTRFGFQLAPGGIDITTMEAQGWDMSQAQREGLAQFATGDYRSKYMAYRRALQAGGRADLFDALTAGRGGEMLWDLEGTGEGMEESISSSMAKAVQSIFKRAFTIGFRGLTGQTAESEWMQQLWSEIGAMPGEQRAGALGTVMGALTTVSQTVGGGWEGVMAGGTATRADQFTTMLDEAQGQIDLLAAGWENMSLVDRATELQAIGDVFSNVTASMESEIRALEQLRKQSDRDIDLYLERLDLSGMTKSQQQTYYRQQIEEYMGLLGGATNVQDISDYRSELMRYLNSLTGIVDMGGFVTGAGFGSGETWEDYLRRIAAEIKGGVGERVDVAEETLQTRWEEMAGTVQDATGMLITMTESGQRFTDWLDDIVGGKFSLPPVTINVVSRGGSYQVTSKYAVQ